MKVAAMILGILGGIAGLGGAIFALFVGGIGGAFGASGAGMIAKLGILAIPFAILGIVGGAMANVKPKAAGIMMIISAVGGTISISMGYIIAAPILLIGGIIALVTSKNQKTENNVVGTESTPSIPTPKKVWYKNKKTWIGAVLVVFALYVVSGFISGANDKNLVASVQQQQPQQNQSAIKMSPKQLRDEYRENEMAADKKYKGNLIEITGTIDRISDGRTVSISVDALTSIQCSFSKDQDNILLQLKKGQTVTIQGIGNGKSIAGVVLNDCKVIPSDTNKSAYKGLHGKIKSDTNVYAVQSPGASPVATIKAGETVLIVDEDTRGMYFFVKYNNDKDSGYVPRSNISVYAN